MPQKGTFTALQKLKPITEGFGEIVEAGVEDILADKAKKEIKKKELSKKFGLDYGSLFEVVTGTKSIDESYARGVNSARDFIGDIHNQIKRNPALADDVSIQMKLQNAKNFSKNLKTIADRYTAFADTVGKGMSAGGNLSNWNKNTLSDLNSIFQQANLDVNIDPETGLPIAVTAELDENGIPTGRLKNLNLIEVLDGRGLTNTVERWDYLTGVTEIGTKLGDDEEAKVEGFLTTEIQQWEGDVEEKARNTIRAIIGNEFSPNDIAKSVWADKMGGDPKELDANDMKRIEDFLTKSVEAFYDEKYIEKKAFGAEQTAISRRKKAEKEKGLGLRLRTDEEGVPTKKNLVGVSGDLRGPALQYTLPKELRIGLKGQNRFTTDVYLTDGGKVAYQETKYTKAGKDRTLAEMAAELEAGTSVKADYKVTTSTEGGRSTDYMNDLARDLNFADLGELKTELERIRDEKFGETTTKTDTSKYNRN